MQMEKLEADEVVLDQLQKTFDEMKDENEKKDQWRHSVLSVKKFSAHQEF